MILIRTLVTLVLAVPAFWLAMRYNMHMFQLNVYKNNEQRTWLRKNVRLQWILDWAMILGIIRALLPAPPAGKPDILGITADVLIWLTLAVIIAVYRLMAEMNSKKPLKFTPRVKRMTVTVILISLLLAILVCCVSYFAGASAAGFAKVCNALKGAAVFLTGAQLFMNMIANTVNHPVEAAVNRHYINDAKRILRKNPGLIVIGVTGSYGKTSVKFYLETLLKAKYNVLVTPESYNTPMGVVITIRKHLKPSHEIFVCEMGARYVGDIKEVCDIAQPDHGVITSIGPQHLDTFGSIENIQSTKFELADSLPEGGILFLNGDNEYIERQLEKRLTGGEETPPAYNNTVMYHSAKTGDGYFASDISVTAAGTEFTATTPDGESERFGMKLVGAHNVINVMAAIAVAQKMRIPLRDLKIPVRRLKPAAHRMEMKTQGDVTLIDDAFNSNPVGSRAAVETLALFEGTRILVTPGMVELGSGEDEYNRKFGGYAAECCDYILLVGRKQSRAVREGALEAGFPEERLMVFDRENEAIQHAYGIKCSGHRYILLENDLPDNY